MNMGKETLIVRQHRILLVGDEEDILIPLKRLLHLGGYEIVTAITGEDALRRLHEDNIPLVISDYCLPGIDGVDLIRHIKEISSHTIGILLPGEVDDVRTASEAMHRGSVDRYITKPWDKLEFRMVVGDILEKWEIRQENRRLGKRIKRQSEKIRRLNRTLQRAKEQLTMSLQHHMSM